MLNVHHSPKTPVMFFHQWGRMGRGVRIGLGIIPTIVPISNISAKLYYEFLVQNKLVQEGKTVAIHHHLSPNKRGVLNVPHHHTPTKNVELSDEKRFPTCTLWFFGNCQKVPRVGTLCSKTANPQYENWNYRPILRATKSCDISKFA